MTRISSILGVAILERKLYHVVGVKGYPAFSGTIDNPGPRRSCDGTSNSHNRPVRRVALLSFIPLAALVDAIVAQERFILE